MAEKLEVRLRASGKGGSHTAYFKPEGQLVIEWYDFGDDAPYESANMLAFDADQQNRLADALGLPPNDRSALKLLSAIQSRFDSYFEAQEFARASDIPFVKSVNFWP